MKYSILSMLVFAFVACATAQTTPSEKIAREYAQAFLRRDVETMKTMELATAKSPTPMFGVSSQKVIRTCPPEPGNTPNTQNILILYGSPTATQFAGMLVSVGNYGEQWLVSKANLSKTNDGRPIVYSRTCGTTTTSGGGY